jgi:hypothetical protein
MSSMTGSGQESSFPIAGPKSIRTITLSEEVPSGLLVPTFCDLSPVSHHKLAQAAIDHLLNPVVALPGVLMPDHVLDVLSILAARFNVSARRATS